ncbi:uncharacterized protein [Pyrus communis]|uniref:uncharacterized protein n=1 Tax=Pyrus communis TaxID=23211 RepID=UPI0035BFD3DA
MGRQVIVLALVFVAITGVLAQELIASPPAPSPASSPDATTSPSPSSSSAPSPSGGDASTPASAPSPANDVSSAPSPHSGDAAAPGSMATDETLEIAAAPEGEAAAERPSDAEEDYPTDDLSRLIKN